MAANKFTLIDPQDREAARLIANTSPGFDERGYFDFMSAMNEQVDQITRAIETVAATKGVSKL
jgi:hypothetical protein